MGSGLEALTNIVFVKNKAKIVKKKLHFFLFIAEVKKIICQRFKKSVTFKS